MQLRKLQLKNFCQHRDLEINFDPGLNLILGPNGSGKSNLIGAVQFALTGDLQKHTREEAVCQAAGEKEESWVKLTFQHLDYTITVFRGIRPVTHTLRCIMGSSSNYMAELEGYTDVNKYLLELLDLQKKQLEDYVFIAQGALDRLIDKSKEQRTLELAKVFGVADTERIWEALGNKITKIEIPATADVVALENKAAAAANEAKEAQAAIEDVKEMMLSEEQQVQYQQDIDNKLNYESLLIRYYDIIDELDAGEEALTAYHHLEADKKALRQLQEAVVHGQGLADAAREVLSQWREYRVYQQQIARLNTKAEKLRETIKNRTPVYPGFNTNLHKATEDLELLGQMDREYNIKIQAVEKSIKDAVCVTCKRPFDNYDGLKEQLPELKQKLSDVRDEVTPLVSATGCKQLRDDVRKLLQEYRGLKTAIGSIVEPPIKSEEDCKADIAQLQELQKDNKDLSKYINEKSNECSKLLGRQFLLQEQLETKYQWLLAHIPTIINRRDYKMFVDGLAQAKEDAKQLQSLINIYKQKQFEAGRYSQELTDALKTVAERKKLLSAREYLVSLRELFHRGGLPKILIETYIDTLAEDVNEFLSLFDAPFKVRRGEHLGFDALFAGCSRVISDKLLSGGQKVVLSLAFRVALNSRFTASLGLLSLDEPTIHLDKASRACLPAILERLRELCQLKNVQILFITHDEDLMNLSDNVIQLGA